MQKALSDFRPGAINAFLALSLVVLTFDVAPLSAMAKGMDQLRAPSFTLLLLFTLFCLLIRQLGGAVLSNIEWKLDNKFNFSFNAIALLSYFFLFCNWTAPVVGMFGCWLQGIQPCKWKGNRHQ
jgi:hypothetical protein